MLTKENRNVVLSGPGIRKLDYVHSYIICRLLVLFRDYKKANADSLTRLLYRSSEPTGFEIGQLEDENDLFSSFWMSLFK